MPVVLKIPVSGGGMLALWKIDEPETVLSALCTDGEGAAAAGFSTLHRRCEYFAWHALLHELLPGATASHDAAGGPVLHLVATDTYAGSGPAPVHIGVSHTRGYAAVIVASQPCAVDIEQVDRDFSRAARRFISPEEESLCPGILPPSLFRALVWCAKETAYKWARRDGLDLLHDIRITSIRPGGNTPAASPALQNPHTLELSVADQSLTVSGWLFDGLCCVYGIR